MEPDGSVPGGGISLLWGGGGGISYIFKEIAGIAVNKES